MGCLILGCMWLLAAFACGQDAPQSVHFDSHVRPLISTYCLRCHKADNAESGIRVDILEAIPSDAQLFLLKDMLRQLESGDMPPADEPQLKPQERSMLIEWLSQSLEAARRRPVPRNGSVRRLTVAQYRNTLRNLLGIQEDLTDTLPPDGQSKDGFTNHAQTMGLSPLQVEAYLDIAEQAVERALVDITQPPTVQAFRMSFGKQINANPCPDTLILGANSLLLDNADFEVTELPPAKPFPVQPFVMQKSYEFIEGYAGNDTVRGWRKFESIYHSVFACMRGTPGYPKGEAYEVIDNGLLLRPAIPSPEIFGQSNTYGPHANFKISLRQLPEHGNFRVRVQAACYDDGLLLDPDAPPQSASVSQLAAPLEQSIEPETSVQGRVSLPRPGIYQIDVQWRGQTKPPHVVLRVGIADRQFSGQVTRTGKPSGSPEESHWQTSAFLVLRLPAGEVALNADIAAGAELKQINLTPLEDESELARRFLQFESRCPTLGVYLGLRRDCGSTLTQVGRYQPVIDKHVKEFVFEGAIRDFPSPDVEADNVNYLAGIREIGVRSEYTDGRDMPRLRIQSVEFEGPYYEQWPPTSHRRIFGEVVSQPDDPQQAKIRAREIIQRFASRAFRRPLTADQEQRLLSAWESFFDHQKDFIESIKDALVVILTSPEFLFLVENSPSPAAEDLDDFELASKLSYFLWNMPPDDRLLQLAGANALRPSLSDETYRLMRDPKIEQFLSEFTSEWLSLDKLDVLSVDSQKFPRLTRDAKANLRLEPLRYLQHLLSENLPIRNLIDADFVVVNEVVASYYGLQDKCDSGLQFIAVPHQSEHLGGLLAQAGIMAGLSNGRQSHPIKRGAWLARKIIAEPPDDPPPNVPQLKEEDDGKLTLREKLEVHRNQKGCAKCHAGIDPWGLPLEAIDAGGLHMGVLADRALPDTRSTLPDGTEVEGLKGLKQYLARQRIDRIAFSFAKHLATYAIGRTLTYHELEELQQRLIELRDDGYRLQDIVQLVVNSDFFLKK